MSAWPFLEIPSFQKVWRKYHISVYFFWKRSSFIFLLRCKIIFSGKRNTIFSDNTRKIIFQRIFFGKTIFSGRQEKENMVFYAVYMVFTIEGFLEVVIEGWLDEPTTTEFHSDALTDWAIKLWVELAFRANFVQLVQFHRLFSVTFHFSYCLRQSPRLFSN